jgi:hypothetical protein
MAEWQLYTHTCPYVFAAGVQCTTSTFGWESRRMFGVNQHFGEFWRPYIGQAFRTRPTIYPPWKWQLQCLPKRWLTPDIRRDSHPKAEVVQTFGATLIRKLKLYKHCTRSVRTTAAQICLSESPVFKFRCHWSSKLMSGIAVVLEWNLSVHAMV